MNITSLFKSTAWPMAKPVAWGPFHSLFFFIGLAVCVFLVFILRKGNNKTDKIILTAIGSILLISEVYKQLFYTLVIGQGEYQWWIFPFQMCSVPMYLCLIAPWLREGKIQKGMYNFLVFYNLFGGFISFLEPSGLCHEYWTLTLHAFTWHMLLIFIGLYLIARKKCGVNFKDFLTSFLTFFTLCVVAFIINVTVGGITGKSINMFFVGPEISSLAVFKDIATKCGWYVSTILYIFSLSLAAFIVFLAVKYGNKLYSKIKTKYINTRTKGLQS